MTAYNINKGIGREVEFHGLKAQYLFYFAGGLLGDFLLVIVLYMMNVGQLFCILLGVALGAALVALTFRLNARYGSLRTAQGGGPQTQAPTDRPPQGCTPAACPPFRSVSPLISGLTMRSILKTATLENKFPILSVEKGASSARRPTLRSPSG